MATEPPPEAVSLPDPPTDGITQLSYLPVIASTDSVANNDNNNNSNSLLASTSFDGAVRIHDTKKRKCLLSQSMESGPLLSLATPKGVNALVTGGLDGTGKYCKRVRLVDLINIVICVSYCEQMHSLGTKMKSVLLSSFVINCSSHAGYYQRVLSSHWKACIGKSQIDGLFLCWNSAIQRKQQ